MIGRIASIGFIAASLGACGTYPTYRLSDTASTAHLTINGEGSPWICVSGERQALKTDATAGVDIPGGKKITVGADYSKSIPVGTGSTTYSCTASRAFTPRAGQRYFLDLEVDAGKCVEVIYIESKANRTGLAFEPSLGPTSECVTVKRD